MTHEAKPRDPIIKQHLDAIEDQTIAAAIANRMAQVHDSDGSRYSHETHIGTHDSMRYIADACARVYTPDMTHEEVWHAGLRHLVSKVLESAYSIDSKALDKKALGDAEWDRSMSLHAAIAMYAFERQSSTKGNDDMHEIDPIILSTVPNLREALSRVTSHMRAFGTIVYDESKNEATPLYAIVAERGRELEQMNYQTVLKTLRDPSDVPREGWEAEEDYKRNKYNYLRVRLAESITTEQYDTLLDAVRQFTLAGHPFNAAALRALPRDYLANAYEQDGKAAQILETILEAYIHGTIPGEIPPQNFYTVLDDYFPGGLTGAAAQAHPLMKRLYDGHGSPLRLLMEAIPHVEYTLGRGTSREIMTYNAAMRSIMRATFREILGDSDFATSLYESVKDATEPRAYNRVDKQSLDDQECHYLLVLLRELQQTYGTETLQQLHEQFDLSAYDYLTDRDIDTLLGLQRADPEVIKRLQSQDISLVMYDARGSHNRAIQQGMSRTDSNEPSQGRIPISWQQPSSFYRAISLLEQHNIQFCNLVFNAHGLPGGVYFNKGDSAIVLTSGPTSKEQTEGDTQLSHRAGPLRLSIDESQLGRIVRDRMCLPKFAETQGMPVKKRIIFANCYSDVEPNAQHQSIAEIASRAIGRAQLWHEPSKPLRSRATPRRPADDTVDSIIIGTVNTTANIATADGPRLVGPGRGEPDEFDQGKAYTPNTILLTPAVNHVWMGGKKMPGRGTLSIKRSYYDGKIIAS